MTSRAATEAPSTGERTHGASSVLRLWPLMLGIALLSVLWFGPLPERARGSFAAHMVMHMGIVAVAAPLVAIGLSRLWPALLGRIPPGLALAAAFAELVIVWGWHAPALHDAARASFPLLLVEQASFLLAGLLVWCTAIGASRGSGPESFGPESFGPESPEGEGGLGARAAGVAGLLMTSMHMTLLGALLLFSPRALYACADLCAPAAAMTPLEDQALGGVIMLIVGGAAYLAGGLTLLAQVLKGPPDSAVAEARAPEARHA